MYSQFKNYINILSVRVYIKYIGTYIYISLYICIHVYISMYAYTYTYTYTCIYRIQKPRIVPIWSAYIYTYTYSACPCTHALHSQTHIM